MDFPLEYILVHCGASAFMWRIIFINLVFIELHILCSLFSCISQSPNKYLTIQKDFLIFLPVVAPLTSTFLASRSTVRYPYSLWAVPCFTNSVTDISGCPCYVWQQLLNCDLSAQWDSGSSNRVTSLTEVQLFIQFIWSQAQQKRDKME